MESQIYLLVFVPALAFGALKFANNTSMKAAEPRIAQSIVVFQHQEWCFLAFNYEDNLVIKYN